MAKQAKSIVVSQHNNPNHKTGGDPSTEFIYKVVQAKNTLTVAIGEILTSKRAQALIDSGTQVTIQQTK